LHFENLIYFFSAYAKTSFVSCMQTTWLILSLASSVQHKSAECWFFHLMLLLLLLPLLYRMTHLYKCAKKINTDPFFSHKNCICLCEFEEPCVGDDSLWTSLENREFFFAGDQHKYIDNEYWFSVFQYYFRCSRRK
jgi:hypothetical protein